MKKDLVLSIVLAVFGVIISYFICNLFVGEPSPFPVKGIDGSVDLTLAEPSAEVFNYESINPTVEVYIGSNDNCTQFDADGNCVYTENQSASDTPSDQGNQ